MMNNVASFAVLLLLSIPSFAQVANGDFESWSNSTPNAWTTIDSGIKLSRSSSRVRSGQYSAQVDVRTASQASTDIRQSLAVIAGQSYVFSVWVNHTEGSTRARLYVDGYRDYSNAALSNQWQKIEYSYTATSNTTIEVGLRFYDVAGFDGSELVYIDNFEPGVSAAPSPTPTPSTPPTNGCVGSEVTLRLQTDNYGAETSWQITNSNGGLEFTGRDYASNTLYEGDLCLNPGTYTLSLFDVYGDGMCCRYGNGFYSLFIGSTELATGGSFGSREDKSFTVSTGNPSLEEYYRPALGLSGFSLKSALHDIIDDHNNQGYGALWNFYQAHEIDRYYENDGSILDIYSERPGASDPYSFTKVSDQCGSYRSEGDCYNREHSFPRSWFGGQNEPMNSDVHHIFASDGFVNAQRGSFPYGEVANASFTSRNGSRLGESQSSTGHSGTVFEPIDEFKGDLARAQFYIATRYEDRVFTWEGNSSSANAVLDGSAGRVFEPWYLELLRTWHNQDPVSAKERARNDAAFEYQGNRNPFVDYPEFVERIWGS